MPKYLGKVPRRAFWNIPVLSQTTESQNRRGWKGPLEVAWSIPCLYGATWSFPVGITPCHSHWGCAAVPACSPSAFFHAS